MADLLVLVLAVAFFALAYGLLKGCERIIGPDVETERVDTERQDEVAEEAA